MDHSRMSEFMKKLAVGWGVMTPDEFDAWTVMYPTDREAIAEILRKAVDESEEEISFAWLPLHVAWTTRDELWQAAAEANDDEVREELERRANIDLSAFFPDKLRYPDKDIPGMVVTG